DVRRCHWTEVIGDAQTLSAFLTREVEARDLARRAVSRVGGRIVDQKVVALRLGGEEAVHHLGLEPSFALRFTRQALEHRLEFVLHRRVILRARAAATPLQAIQLVQIEQREQLVERYVVVPQRSGAEEW